MCDDDSPCSRTSQPFFPNDQWMAVTDVGSAEETASVRCLHIHTHTSDKDLQQPNFCRGKRKANCVHRSSVRSQQCDASEESDTTKRSSIRVVPSPGRA